VQSAVVAFAFSVLIFFASCAAIALEPPPQPLGFGHLTLLLLATLQAVTGFVVSAGPTSLVDRHWVPVVGCATASVAACVVTVVAAIKLANTIRLDVSREGAALVLFIVLFGGVALLVQHVYAAFGVMPDKSKQGQDQ
jgi:hypothetical protein